MALSNESAYRPSSGFAHGVEFEETFPEPQAETTPDPARFPPAPVRLGAAAAPSAPHLRLVPTEPVADASETQFQEQLERRLREAEAMVKQTIASVRLEEEKRLAEWVLARRDEEERRLAKWTDERRSAVERSIEHNSMSTDGVVQRIEEMLVEWQDRFERRLDQRRTEDERLAARARVSDEERLRAWRGELEHALTQRFAHADRAAAATRQTDRHVTFRAGIASASNARDVGRILREGVAHLIRTSAFALAVHRDRDEVAYRYCVATDDEVGQLLRRESVDDGAESAAAHTDGWVRAQRTVRAGSRNLTVHTAQLAIRVDDTTVGVLTLQSEGAPISDDLLALVAEFAPLAAPRLAELRDAGSFRGI